jgi:hypothetical protein
MDLGISMRTTVRSSFWKRMHCDIVVFASPAIHLRFASGEILYYIDFGGDLTPFSMIMGRGQHAGQLRDKAIEVTTSGEEPTNRFTCTVRSNK